MKRIWTLVTAPATGRRRWQVALALVLAVLAPAVVVTTLVPQRDDDTVLPVALVNLDEPIQADGTLVAMGKLLTQNLVSADAVDWVLTDSATADAGLAAGDYLAVVTIPQDFSKTASTLGSESPQTSTISVRTSTAHGYLGGVIAEALSAGIPTGVSTVLTQQFLEGTMSAFTALNQGIGQASEGAATIADGLGAATEGSQALADGTGMLAQGLGALTSVLDALPTGARGLGELAAVGAATSGDLAVRLAARSAEAALVDLEQDAVLLALADLRAKIEADPTAPVSSLTDELEVIAGLAAGVDASIAGTSAALAGDAVTAAELAVGSGTIAAISGPVADGLGRLSAAAGQAGQGAATIAQGDQALTEGLGALTEGSAALASGLSDAAAAIPSYTEEQRTDIAQVVATPITVDATSVGGPTTALASALAALVPVAQWLGAIAVFLVVAPFARNALTTAAPARRIAADGLVVVAVVAAVQALLVWGALLFAGISAERIAIAGGLALLMALAFAFVHQALVAFLPRAGLIVSIALLGLQVAAAGTLSPQALTPAAAGPLALLPLSIALQGTQDLVGGTGSGVLVSAIGLAIWAVLGMIGTVVAVRRARAGSLSVRELARV